MTQLYAAIRPGKCKPGIAEEFARRVRKGVLPVMKSFDGFADVGLPFLVKALS